MDPFKSRAGTVNSNKHNTDNLPKNDINSRALKALKSIFGKFVSKPDNKVDSSLNQPIQTNSHKNETFIIDRSPSRSKTVKTHMTQTENHSTQIESAKSPHTSQPPVSQNTKHSKEIYEPLYESLPSENTLNEQEIIQKRIPLDTAKQAAANHSEPEMTLPDSVIHALSQVDEYCLSDVENSTDTAQGSLNTTAFIGNLNTVRELDLFFDSLDYLHEDITSLNRGDNIQGKTDTSIALLKKDTSQKITSNFKPPEVTTSNHKQSYGTIYHQIRHLLNQLQSRAISDETVKSQMNSYINVINSHEQLDMLIHILENHSLDNKPEYAQNSPGLAKFVAELIVQKQNQLDLRGTDL